MALFGAKYLFKPKSGFKLSVYPSYKEQTYTISFTGNTIFCLTAGKVKPYQLYRRSKKKMFVI